MENPEYFTAIHEAGHTVAMMRFGYSCLVCTIEPESTKNTSGHVSHSEDPDQSPENRIISDLAGYCSDVDAGQDEQIARHGASGDFEDAEDLLGRHYAGERTMDEFLERTFVFVRRESAAIQRIAKELLDRRTLSMEEVDVILEAVDGNVTEEQLACYLSTFRSR